MREVVIIGGGLSGLAAAHRLQQLGHDYTLIEVKPRLGGSIATHQVAGFYFDSGPMGYPIANPPAFEAYLRLFGLDQAVYLLPEGDSAGLLAFTQGAEMLIAALSSQLNGAILRRMAVSTLGRRDDGRGFLICMENGIVLDAAALIVAAPACYAQRMFQTLVPEISYRLHDYRYDAITRISVGYLGIDALETDLLPDYPMLSYQVSRHPARMPAPGIIIQTALRYDPLAGLPDDPVGALAAVMHWPENPDGDHIAAWDESDPLMWRDPTHPQIMTTIQALLPDGVALIGSDYIATNAPPCLDERTQQGVAAAERIHAYLASRSNG